MTQYSSPRAFYPLSPPASLIHNGPHISVMCPVKRCLDIVGALVGLVIWAIAFIPIAIAIKLDSPGPVLYRQTRCGLWGKPFTMRKFRSMVVDADSLKKLVPNEAKGLVFKNRNDPRVTRVGRFLRKTSLDEFPQFWNVLMGEMSLVGTRPPTLDEVMGYNDHHWKRLNVKPGMTGEWQVHGRSSIGDFEDIVNLDIRYQARWTRWYDLQVIFRTLYVLFNRSGAY